jgi:hypothetical protein
VSAGLRTSCTFARDLDERFPRRAERPVSAKGFVVFRHTQLELIGGAYGEMTVTMQYLFQGWNCRVEGKYKDLIMDTATEEMGHVEMLATMVARLLEGAPATATADAVKDPVMAAVLGAWIHSRPLSPVVARCRPTATAIRGTAGTSSRPATCSPISGPMSRRRRRAGCRPRGCTA